MTETPIDFDLHESLLSIREAAELAGVERTVLHNWIKRGILIDGKRRRLPAHWDETGQWWVRPIDVLRIKAATRSRTTVRSG